jgi:hypothetical protein
MTDNLRNALIKAREFVDDDHEFEGVAMLEIRRIIDNALELDRRNEAPYLVQELRKIKFQTATPRDVEIAMAAADALEKQFAMMMNVFTCIGPRVSAGIDYTQEFKAMLFDELVRRIYAP